MSELILLVDDEPRVLDGYRRTLRRSFTIETATSGAEGLEAVKARSFAVVVSDFQMPEMDGVAFLTKVRDLSPDTVRVMLTGQANLDSSMAAVNEGRVFRFLTKPCSAENLAAALNAAVDQHRLIRSERELLEETLQRTTRVLIDVLGLVDSATHDLSVRVRDQVALLCKHVGLVDTWEFELAAMLCQLGTIALPGVVLDKFRAGAALTDFEDRLVGEHPQSGFNLLHTVPRLERVARMVLSQETPPAHRPLAWDAAEEDDEIVAMGAHLLNVALVYDRLSVALGSPEAAVQRLRAEGGPPFRMALIEAIKPMELESQYTLQRCSVTELRPGMVLNADALLSDGTLLLSEKQELSAAHVERVRSFAASRGVKEPIEVLVPAE